MATSEITVKIIKGEIVEEKFKSEVRTAIADYYRIVETYESKAFDVKDKLKSLGVTKAELDRRLEEELLKENYYYSRDKHSKNFNYRIPGAQLRATKIDEKEIGEPEDHFNHTVLTYRITITVYFLEPPAINQS